MFNRLAVLIGQLINAHLNIFKDAEQDHIVDTGADEDDRQALVHAGFGDSL